MASNTAQLVLKADSRGIRKGTDDLKKLDKQAGRSEGKVKSLGLSFAKMAAAGAVAGVAVAAIFTRAAIKNTIEQDNAVAQLNASLKSTGRFSEQASKGLQDYASSLQQVSIFGDEAIITMQSQLLTFKALGGDILPRATRAVLDLSAKMGTDLKSSAKQLGLALNDPATGLSRLSLSGITFSDSQKEVIKNLTKTNQLAKAQSLILDELESEFGGSAKAARDTLGGALKAVGNNFGDLLEVSGDNSSGVVGSLNDLADILADPDVKEGFQTLATGVLTFISAIAQAPAFVGFLKDELKELFGIIDDDDIVRQGDRIARTLSEIDDQITAIGKLRDAPAYASPAAQQALDGQIEALKEKQRVIRETADIEAAARASGGDTTVTPGTVAAIITPNEPDVIDPKLLTAADRAAAALRQTLRDLAVETGGELVAANQAYEDSLAQVTEQENALLAVGELSAQQQADLQSAREGALLTRERTIELINEEAAAEAALLTPAQEILSSLELELELMGLTNIEREKRIALLRADADENSEVGIQITETLDKIAAQDMLNGQMNNFANQATDAFLAFADGSKSASEAFSDFATSMLRDIARMIIQQLILNAISSFMPSSSVPGASGSFPKRASGGPVEVGIPYTKDEAGPEIFVPNERGKILPNGTGMDGGAININIDARETENPARLLALVPLIQQQVEQSISLKQRRGYI